MADMKTCFIVMPLTTPDHIALRYKEDKEHFKHVLEHLFIPSIEKAQLKAIPPIAKGSDLIHGEIVKNIEAVDLVLCDMSILNPNVFFELGIRTALNKPICLVKDDWTQQVPFDTTIINHYTYSSALNVWEQEKEIESLTKHIRESLERSEEKNSLWKYFGLSSIAHPTKQDGGVEGKLDYLILQVRALRDRVGEQKPKDRISALADRLEEIRKGKPIDRQLDIMKDVQSYDEILSMLAGSNDEKK